MWTVGQRGRWRAAEMVGVKALQSVAVSAVEMGAYLAAGKVAHLESQSEKQ